jgi:cytosine/adenosine deaminase-related metal-dependent hydrolase
LKIIHADYIYTENGFKKNKAIAFDESIQAIDNLEILKQCYPKAEVIHTTSPSVLYPSFTNTHVHLEFSANKTSLHYGKFMPWLDSVITKREDLVGKCNNTLMMQECKNMMRSGISLFGAISSFANELEVCEKSPQRVVFFNELIGSNASVADMLYNDFLERLKASASFPASSHIYPAIAIHSPYAVHPIIIQKAVNLAKKDNLVLSAHFLESPEEREWLEKGQGAFKIFFEKYFNTSIPVSTIDEFIHAFDSYPTHFTHCTQATEKELDYLASKGHSIAHCPRSNRYLGCGRLPIETLKLPYSIATDGLSSNDSLNLFDELRATLMLHNHLDINTLANDLIHAITAQSADILGINCGKLQVGKLADFALITLPEFPQREEELALWTILHTKEVEALYIGGKNCL